MEFYYDRRSRDLKEAKSVCAKAGGMIFEPKNELITKAVSDYIYGLSTIGRYSTFWLGIYNNTHNGTFVYDYDSTPEFTIEPNGEPSSFFWRPHTGKENCALIYEGLWYISSCEYYSTTACFRYYQGKSNSINIFTFDLFVLAD